MIKWECNFNIPDSTSQLDIAYVKIVDYKTINERTEVNLQICDVTGDIVVKEYQKEFHRTFQNTDELYEEIVKDYENSVIVK
jgi:hypothetical protein